MQQIDALPREGLHRAFTVPTTLPARPDILGRQKAPTQMDHTTQKRFHFPGSAEFVVRDHFAVGFEPVNISYLGANFRRIFLDLVVAPQPSGFYSAMNLTQRLTGPQIVEPGTCSCCSEPTIRARSTPAG